MITKTKIFILDAGVLIDCWDELFFDKLIQKGCEIKTSCASHLEEIPSDYDLYSIHLSQTSECAIRELREKNSYAWIYIRSAGSQWDKDASQYANSKGAHGDGFIDKLKKLEELKK